MFADNLFTCFSCFSESFNLRFDILQQFTQEIAAHPLHLVLCNLLGSSLISSSFCRSNYAFQASTRVFDDVWNR